MKHDPGFCGCLSQLELTCAGSGGGGHDRFLQHNATTVDMMHYSSELGRIVYTVSILCMFGFIILLLLVRSISRSKSTIEMEALLEAMRYREELDHQQRQKRRLQKAKNKVTAWLTKANGKLWIPPVVSSTAPAKPLKKTSMHSSSSFIPEIVISNTPDDRPPCRQNSYTPSLSLMYDFDASTRKNSMASQASGTIDLFQLSEIEQNFFEDIESRASRQRSASQAVVKTLGSFDSMNSSVDGVERGRASSSTSLSPTRSQDDER